MYGGYGIGGLSSMYGGGGMYGGGLSSMYGGGGMYGGGLSSMYGGGGMYGGGLSSMYGGGGMYGGGPSSMYGGGGMGTMTGGMMGGYGANGMNGVDNPGSMLRGTGLPNGQGPNTNSLLPAPSPDNLQLSAPKAPVVGETSAERRARRRKERKEEREIIEKQRQQKRQFIIQSNLEIAGHLLQIFMQVMRSGLELFGVGFGTYYSIQALKAVLKGQEVAASRSTTQNSIVKTQQAVMEGAGGEGGIARGSRWKVYLLASAVFIALEVMYNIFQRKRQFHGGRPSDTIRRLHKGKDMDTADSSDNKLDESLSETDEESRDDAFSDCSTDSATLPVHSENVIRDQNRRFVAVYDYDAFERDGFIGFKAGDHFVVEEYAENGWCEAKLLNADNRVVSEGLVPGNFIRPIECETKL